MAAERRSDADERGRRRGAIRDERSCTVISVDPTRSALTFIPVQSTHQRKNYHQPAICHHHRGVTRRFRTALPVRDLRVATHPTRGAGRQVSSPCELRPARAAVGPRGAVDGPCTSPPLKIPNPAAFGSEGEWRCVLHQADTTTVAASASAPAHMISLRAASAAVGTGLPTPPTTTPQATRRRFERTRLRRPLVAPPRYKPTTRPAERPEPSHVHSSRGRGLGGGLHVRPYRHLLTTRPPTHTSLTHPSGAPPEAK